MRRIQDIVNPGKRSIRSVSINRESKRRRRRPDAAVSVGETSRDYQSRGSSSFGIWFIAVVAIIFLFFTFTILFSGTKVVITPKTQNVTFDTNLRAEKDADASTLAYEIMTVTRDVSRKVASIGEEFREEKASGTIIVYNDYNTQDQKLIAKTRFENPDGLVYRIKDPIVVPGQTKDSSGKKTPGSIEVKVYADEAGEGYNIGMTDFTVPGFKGAPQYDGFYARSKTAMTGGFSGIVKTVADSDRNDSVGSMQTELREMLLEELRAQVPSDFVLYDDAIVFDFETLPDQKEGDQVSVSLRGEISAVIFNKKKLSEHIARGEIDGYDGLEVEGENLDGLVFVLVEKDTLDLKNAQEIDFSLKGSTKLVWQYDADALKTDLVGRRKRDVDWVLAEYPSIIEAQIIMRPFWKRVFPDTEKKIKIVSAKQD